jgi:dinuclear metal center YbgI/SA1388 family protein
MPTVLDVSRFLEEYAPPQLAESWDNVGLLVGSPAQTVRRIMTCLTVTLQTADEAVREGADLIVSHHPLPFRPLPRLTTETLPGRLLLQLVRHGAAIYSPHTAFDSARRGINQRLAEMLQLSEIRPLIENPGAADGLGAGRFGRLATPMPLSDVADRLRRNLRLERLQCVGDLDQPVRVAAVACGSAGEFVRTAIGAGCDLLILGETNFHTCIEAEAGGLRLLLTGHFGSERFGVEHLAEAIAERFPDVRVWPSADERDPLRFIG